MLVGFAVENFKSFEKLSEFSMLSSSKIKDLPEHKRTIKSASILKHAVIYGANAAGKTNFIDAISFMRRALERGLPSESINYYSKKSKVNEERKSSFEIKISIGNKFYAFGFSAKLKDKKITDEWLYELLSNGNSKPIYLRENSKKPEIFVPKMSSDDKKRFLIYSQDYMSFEDRLFITELNRGKRFSQNSSLNRIRSIFLYLLTSLYVIYPYSRITSDNKYFDGTSINEISDLMRMFDTGISKVSVKDVSREELEKTVPKEIIKDIIDKEKNQMMLRGSKKSRGTLRKGDHFFGFEFNGNEEPIVRKLSISHKESIFDFAYAEESDGTKRLFDLVELLINKQANAIYFIDELERSLHPNLTKKFIQEFNLRHKDDETQLILTTHEHNIMNLDLFRRDEIWFIDRDKNNTSNIYSLDRFKERADKKIDKAYLEGRYGAIPIFSEICGGVV